MLFRTQGADGTAGNGAIIVRRGVSLSPLMAGGSGIRTFLETMPQEMPEHLEAGTQNAHSIAGLHAALTFAEGKRETWREQALSLRKQLLSVSMSSTGRPGKSAFTYTEEGRLTILYRPADMMNRVRYSRQSHSTSAGSTLQMLPTGSGVTDRSQSGQADTVRL